MKTQSYVMSGWHCLKVLTWLLLSNRFYMTQFGQDYTIFIKGKQEVSILNTIDCELKLQFLHRNIQHEYVV